jgi:MarR family 2-MHQ and catechol resistance regulon transcriptional repressor
MSGRKAVGSRLQNELKKKRPFELPEQEAILNLLRTNDQFQNRFGKLFREFGITSSQYNVLRILRGEGKPLPCLEISERMIQVVPAMTGLLDRLEAQGLIQRERCTEDRRVVYVDLTPKAKQLLTSMEKPVTSLHSALMGHLTVAELKELSRLLEKARESLGAPADTSAPVG